MLGKLTAPLLAKLLGGLAGVMALISLGLFLSLKMEQRHSNKLQSQVIKLSAELERVRQDGEARQGRVNEVRKGQGERLNDADRRARIVEQAPVPDDCSTPDAVLEAVL